MARSNGAVRTMVAGVGLLCTILLAGLVGGGIFCFRMTAPALAQVINVGLPTDPSCVAAAEATLSRYLGDPRPSGDASATFAHGASGEAAFAAWSKGDGIACLAAVRPEFSRVLSSTGLPITERLAMAYNRGLIALTDSGDWIIPERSVPSGRQPPQATAMAMRPALANSTQAAVTLAVKPEIGITSRPPSNTAAAPQHDSCIAGAEAALANESHLRLRNKVSPAFGRIMIDIPDGESAVFEVLQKFGKCLRIYRPEFWALVGSDPVGLRDRLNRAYDVSLLLPDKNGSLRIPSAPLGAKPSATGACSSPNGCEAAISEADKPHADGSSMATTPRPSESAPASAPQREISLADISKRLDGISAKVDAASQSDTLPRAYFILILLLTAVVILLVAQLWFAWRKRTDPAIHRLRPSEWSGEVSTDLHTRADGGPGLSHLVPMMAALSDALRRMQADLARQQDMLVNLVERAARSDHVQDRAEALSSLHRRDFGDPFDRSTTRMSSPEPQARVLIQGIDALADYQSLAAAGFPSDQCRLFQDRWQADPVVQRAEAGRFVLKPADAPDEAVMWLLIGAEDRESYPVVLAPAAYDSRMALSNSRPLHAATHGFFNMTSPSGKQAVLECPARVLREGPQKTFACIERGILRA
ncbi:MAG TPA: hypothetical protein VGG99_10565 [Acetobacteraceae bacterium]|jgi:hypothetical protein